MSNIINHEITPSIPDLELKDFVQIFGKIGILSFGGPAGQIALMHKVLVDEKNWLSEKRFLHALNFCMLLPGPEAMQMATYAGWLLRGTWGGILAGTLFVLPGFFILLALSMAYVIAGDVPLVAGLLFGLKAAVLVIVIQALVKVSKRALNSMLAYWIALTALVMLAVFSLPFPMVIVTAGLVGFFLPGYFGIEAPDHTVSSHPQSSQWRYLLKVFVGAIFLWVLPAGLLVITLGRGHVLSEEALFFSKTAVVSFGGAYAVLQYVGQQGVEFYQWLKPDEMVTGLGLAETTPGPLILVLEYVGFVAAYRDPGSLPPLLAGLYGALVTVWFTFVPCFVWIFAGAPFMEQLQNSRALSGAFAAITAAIVGVIANLSLWFGVHVLFGEVSKINFLAGSIELPVVSSIQWMAAAIALTTVLAVLRGWGLFSILGLAAAAGIAVKSFGF